MPACSQEQAGVSRTIDKLRRIKETTIDMMAYEALKNSEIEGEYLSRKDVISSIKNNLGLNVPKAYVRDRRAVGIAKLMVTIRETFQNKLTQVDLFSWHQMLMEGNNNITTGAWRTHETPMQVISGGFGKETVHFEAPPPSRIPQEIQQFLRWFNHTAIGEILEIKSPVVRSAIAQLYFESIHPFEDGNGRMGRVISEKALYQNIGKPAPLSLSSAIEARKNEYYQAIRKAQRSNEITDWIIYFAQTLLQAQNQTEEHILFTIKKANFFDEYGQQLNERQAKVIRKMLREGIEDSEGSMSAKKYMAIAKTSKATATRDLQALTKSDIFIATGGGRSVRYSLKFLMEYIKAND